MVALTNEQLLHNILLQLGEIHTLGGISQGRNLVSMCREGAINLLLTRAELEWYYFDSNELIKKAKERSVGSAEQLHLFSKKTLAASKQPALQVIPDEWLLAELVHYLWRCYEDHLVGPADLITGPEVELATVAAQLHPLPFGVPLYRRRDLKLLFKEANERWQGVYSGNLNLRWQQKKLRVSCGEPAQVLLIGTTYQPTRGYLDWCFSRGMSARMLMELRGNELEDTFIEHAKSLRVVLLEIPTGWLSSCLPLITWMQRLVPGIQVLVVSQEEYKDKLMEAGCAAHWDHYASHEIVSLIEALAKAPID